MTSGVKSEISVYIHIPYCVSKCHYCDFNSYGMGKAPIPETDYLRALAAEIERWSDILAEGREWQASTVYFGGGTPSLFTAEGIRKILEEVRRLVSIPAGTEITLEMNPKTASLEKMRELRSLGVNRLSIGVQSLDEGILSGLGRAHGARDALQTLEWACEADFPRVNIDLMYGLPKQSLAQVESTLNDLENFPLRHLSAYELIVEEGTPFFDRYLEGRLPLPEGSDVLAMREAIRDFAARHGMQPYEISNYAAPHHESEHNGHYWNYDSFIGIGAGAVSFLRCDELSPSVGSRGQKEIYGWRWTQIKNPSEYGQSRNGLEGVDKEPIDRRTAMGEFMMMGLRRNAGIRYASFREKLNQGLPGEFHRAIDLAARRGLMAVEEDGCRLTEEGMLLSNEVLQDFLS